MVSLAMQRHYQYAKYEPTFWRVAKHAAYQQRKYFSEVIKEKKALMLVAKMKNKVLGLILATQFTEPPVYDPEGITYRVDDYVVQTPTMWNTVGIKLLKTLITKLKKRHVKQLIVMVGHKDKAKRKILRKFTNLQIMTEWWVGNI